MAELGGTITLENFVRELLLKRNLEIDINFPRVFTFAMDGLREINMYHAHNYAKVSKLTPDTLGRVEFPNDAVEIKAIGIPRGGVLWSLTSKPNMVTTVSDNDGSDIYNTEIGEGQEIPIEWYGGYMNRGGGNVKGYYNINERARQIVLNGFTGTTIWVYYVASGVDLTGDTLIPRKFKDVLEKYVVYQLASYDDDSRENVVMRRKMEYDESVSKLRNFNWTLDELKDAIYSTYQQTARR